VTHAAITRALPANVVCHTGSSADLLEPLLASIAATGQTLDFVLVDGDHSFEGVQGDLRTLLRSPATSRSVILVHDTMNPEVRAGVESAEIENCPGVVYFEPEFVPGYVYRTGVCRGGVWGGLGLILTDADQASGTSPRQTRYAELFPLVQRMKGELVDPPS
jgi:hypothetical protein